MAVAQGIHARSTLARCAMALLLLGGTAACSDGGGTSDEAVEADAEAPEGCIAPPTTVTVRGGDGGTGGARQLEAIDAVARRVAILPGQMAFDPGALSALESQAAVTPLAAYSVSVADVEIDREPLAGVGLVEVEPTGDGTIATLTVVPPTEAGLSEGAVIVDGALEYETNAELRPLGLRVLRGDERRAHDVDEIEGRVQVLQLTDEAVCLDIDVVARERGQVVGELRGVVQAPVVRASDAFFLT